VYWQQALLQLLHQPAEIARRAALGRQYVAQQRMHAQQAPQREAWYRGRLAQREAFETQRQEQLARRL
jgi:hypothetical protein